MSTSAQSKLDALTAFFKQNMPERAMQAFTSEMDDMQVIPAQKELGLNQYRLSIIKYDALFTWERFPYRICDPRLAFALLTVWQDQESQDLLSQVGISESEPDWDISLDTQEYGTVVLTVPLAEELCIVQAENGAIPFDGKRWDLTSPQVWVASQATVFGAGGDGAPVLPVCD